MEPIETKQQAEAAWQEFCRRRVSSNSTPRVESTRCAAKRGRKCHRHCVVGCKATTFRASVQFTEPSRRVITCGEGANWQEAIESAISKFSQVRDTALEAGAP